MFTFASAVRRVQFALAGQRPNAWRMAWRTGATVCAVVSTGCAVTDGEIAPSVAARQVSMARETWFNFAWQGKPSLELVHNLGQPRFVMNVPGRDQAMTSVMVYGVQDRAAGCVDAFTMEKNPTTEQWVVAGYFCR